MADQKYDLIIVESPHKAKVIGGFLKGLSQEYRVIASKGHIMELPKKQLGVDVNNGFEIELGVIEGKEDVVKDIKKMAANANRIYLASDPDREGEAIAWHLRDIVKRKKDTTRILFHEITKDAIKKAIENAGELDANKYDAQKARRILDRLVGYKISPLLWEKIASGLSAGRVQSVALRIIVDREDEIANFVPEKSFQIIAYPKKLEEQFEAKYFGESSDKKHVLDASSEDLAKKIVADIEKKELAVTAVEAKEKKYNATPPFTTSKMQQAASLKLKMAAQTTMKVAQRLYEGLDLGSKGTLGLITYMRTDSVRTEPNAIAALREHIEKTYGKDYLPKTEIAHKKKTDANTQDAHEAIRPTDLANDPSSVAAYLNDEELKLYTLIWNKFVSSQMNPAIVDQTIVTLKAEGHYFKATGAVERFPGHRVVYKSDNADEKDDDGSLPLLVVDESLSQLKPAKLDAKFTIPPPRYNEASLIKELEECGIGRPSTYSAIMSNIVDRRYVDKTDAKFFPTELGTTLCRALVKHFPVQMDIEFTAKMETELDRIEEGKSKLVDILSAFWSGLSKTLDKAKIEMEKVRKDTDPNQGTRYPQQMSGIKCVKCSGEYVIKKSKLGEEFFSCSTYPVCNSTQDLKRNKAGKAEIKERKIKYRDKPCPECGSKMILKKGGSSNFWGCESYPKCTRTASESSSGITCPDCKKGELTEIKTKAGSTFYGCTNWKNGCKNSTSTKPVENPCLHCKYPIRVIASGGKDLTCPKCRTTTPSV
jgi:DNA topoisomerase-1